MGNGIINNTKKAVFIFFIVFIFSGVLFADPPEDIFNSANLKYQNEDYEGAAALYEKLIDMDKANVEVFYNLGNSYFKKGSTGKAILNYERALRISPRDRDILLNLKIARALTLDKIEGPDRGFILSAIFFFYDKLNIDELTIASSMIFIIMIMFLVFSINFVEKRKYIFYTVSAFGILFIVFIIFLSSKIQAQYFLKEAIVISEEIDIRSGPKEDYLKQFTLHEGTRLRVLKKINNWYEVGLSKDLRGWLPQDSVDII
ncbi:MAG: tetratricopeptide repeat protein [Candidatus Omnitrophota bacterium]